MSMNEKEVSEILQKTPTAEAFATYAACRERDVRNGISRLPKIREQMKQEGFHPVPQDLLAMFRELERAGIGKLSGDKFKWFTSIKKVGSAGSTQSPKMLDSGKKDIVIPKAQKTMVLFFDKNKEITVTFTPNLTRDDVAFLAEKILKECR